MKYWQFLWPSIWPKGCVMNSGPSCPRLRQKHQQNPQKGNQLSCDSFCRTPLTKLIPAEATEASPASFVQVLVVVFPWRCRGSDARPAPTTGTEFQGLHLLLHCCWILTVITALVALRDGISKKLGNGSVTAAMRQVENKIPWSKGRWQPRGCFAYLFRQGSNQYI